MKFTISEAESVEDLAAIVEIPASYINEFIYGMNRLLVDKDPVDWRVIMRVFDDSIDILEILKDLGFLDIF